MRLINADQLEQVLTVAINGMTAMAAAIGAEEDEGVQMELKAYKDILGVGAGGGSGDSPEGLDRQLYRLAQQRGH